MSVNRSLTFINNNHEEEQRRKTCHWINQISPSNSFELHWHPIRLNMTLIQKVNWTKEISFESELQITVNSEMQIDSFMEQCM